MEVGMGVRYRKSINLGHGFRINISKSGIGYSYGVKGARITKTARGTTRTTLSIPNTGISYVNETKRKKQNNYAQSTTVKNTCDSMPSNDFGAERSTDLIEISKDQSIEYSVLLSSFKKAIILRRIAFFLLFLSLFCLFFPILLLSLPLSFIFFIISSKKKVHIEYTLDDYSTRAFEHLSTAWMDLKGCSKLWQSVSEKTVINKRSWGNAGYSAKLKDVQFLRKYPFFIKTNVQPIGFKLEKKKLIFLPDKLLIVNGHQIGAINYTDIDFIFYENHFLEAKKVPADAEIVRTQWLKSNKDGSPDKRFKNNQQFPICRYGEFVIKSSTSLYVDFLCSNYSKFSSMSDHITEFYEMIEKR